MYCHTNPTVVTEKKKVKPPLFSSESSETNFRQGLLTWTRNLNISILTQAAQTQIEGGVRVQDDAVLRCFWCGFEENFIFNLLLFILI